MACLHHSHLPCVSTAQPVRSLTNSKYSYTCELQDNKTTAGCPKIEFPLHAEPSQSPAQATAEITTDVSTSEPSSPVATTQWETITPVQLAVPDTRPRTIGKNKKCGGSPTGTTTDQCAEGFFCQYQTPSYAKCVKDEPISLPDYSGDATHECGVAGTQCMGDKAFLDGLEGEKRTGVCCEEGLRCIFQEPYVGLCADPQLFVVTATAQASTDAGAGSSSSASSSAAATAAAGAGAGTANSSEGSDASGSMKSPDTRPRTIKEHKK